MPAEASYIYGQLLVRGGTPGPFAQIKASI